MDESIDWIMIVGGFSSVIITAGLARIAYIKHIRYYSNVMLLISIF